MPTAPRRTIEQAWMRDVGPVDVNDLIARPPQDWGMIRDRITAAWNASPREIVASCMKCGSPVFIRAEAVDGKRLPAFVHFQGADPECPWHTSTIHPDDARRRQYQGRSPSPAHGLICEQLCRLAALDDRCERVAVERYLPPTQNDHGRYPDVLIEYRGRRPFALEVQISKTFQTEVSSRCEHYPREGIALVWLLHGADFRNPETLPQSFRDVLLKHRENAFVLDTEAIAESFKRRTLVLKCLLRDPKNFFSDQALVTLDDLQHPPRGIPFFEDRLTPILTGKGRVARRPWKEALRSWRDTSPTLWTAVERGHFSGALKSLYELCPSLPYQMELNDVSKYQLVEFVALTFSTMSAAYGDFTNFLTKQSNLQALINSKMPSNDLCRFSPILRHLLDNTAVNHLLEGTVGVHIDRAFANADGNAFLEGECGWDAAEALYPEIFDGITRTNLQQIGTLPAWATPQQTLATQLESDLHMP
mgnify:CR=1 FL=1